MSDYSKLFPINEYYRRVVMPLNKKFRKGSSDKYVCPLHNDNDPSLGVIKSKTGEVCHCFGCGAWCDVIELHQRVMKRHKRRYMDRDEAKKDLCSIFGVSYKDLPDESEKEVSTDKRREELISENRNKFDVSDYRYKFLDGKIQKRGVGYFNALMMSMIWELKNEEV